MSTKTKVRVVSFLVMGGGPANGMALIASGEDPRGRPSGGIALTFDKEQTFSLLGKILSVIDQADLIERLEYVLEAAKAGN